MTDASRSGGRDLTVLCLRIGMAVFFIRAGWLELSSLSGVVGLWQRLNLPFPHVFGPVHAVVEFGRALRTVPFTPRG